MAASPRAGKKRAVTMADEGNEAPSGSLLTDLENAHRFAREHGKNVRYVGKYRHWLVWDGKRWQVDSSAEIDRRAKDTVRRLLRTAATKAAEKAAVRAQSASRIAGMLTLSKSERGIVIRPDELDADPWLLNVDN